MDISNLVQLIQQSMYKVYDIGLQRWRD